MTTTNELLSQKELAAALKRSDRYVQFMVSRGFVMPGGRATISDALAWLRDNPQPCARKPKKAYSI